MSTTQPTKKPYTILLLPALIVAGLAGNYFKYPIFLNIDFLFGSICALLALQFFGTGRGIAAAAIISSYTHILWNHPFAIIIMTAEVAVVGWLMKRRKIGMVLSDLLYWLLLGIPLVWLFYSGIMQAPFDTVQLTMAKQAMNGIANALAARLLFTAYTLRFHNSHSSYREIVYNLLAFFVLIPSLIMLVIGSRNDFYETDQHIRATLARDSKVITQYLSRWVDERKTAVTYLASLAATRTPRQMQPHLEQVRQSDQNFLRLGLLDTDATITAYFPLIDELGQQNIGKNFADRPYIPTLRRTLQPMLSEVVMGRIGTPRPFVTMMAPVVIHQTYSGFITGILGLRQVQTFFETMVYQNSLQYALLDKNSNVIMSSCAEYEVMKPFVQNRGRLQSLGQGISQWIPELPSNTPASERWRKSSYQSETPIGSWSEWKLILWQPVAPFQKTLYLTCSKKLLLLFMILVGALILAELLSRRILVTLDALGLVSRDLPARLAQHDSQTIWPQSSIYEADQLISNFREMADSLSARFHEIRQINQRLELQTEELRQTNESLQQAKNLAESAVVAKSRFMNTVAHEFRTPLSLLASSIDIIDRYADRLSRENRTEQHAHIRNAVQQLSRLIDSVLAFNRLEAQYTLHSPELLDLEQTCCSIGREVEAAWGSGQEFSIVVADNPGSALLDRLLFRQVLENLLTNAFRYTPENRKIVLHLGRQDGWLLLEVTDTGIGIPEEELERIFDPFYRASNVDARRGLGLGLSIVHESVQQLRGTIRISSKAGEGTTVQVALPLDNTTGSKEKPLCV